jgi:hypothetical protein
MQTCDTKNTPNDQNITEIYNSSHDLLLGGKEHLSVTQNSNFSCQSASNSG